MSTSAARPIPVVPATPNRAAYPGWHCISSRGANTFEVLMKSLVTTDVTCQDGVDAEMADIRRHRPGTPQFELCPRKDSSPEMGYPLVSPTSFRLRPVAVLILTMAIMGVGLVAVTQSAHAQGCSLGRATPVCHEGDPTTVSVHNGTDRRLFVSLEENQPGTWVNPGQTATAARLFPSGTELTVSAVVEGGDRLPDQEVVVPDSLNRAATIEFISTDTGINVEIISG